MHMTACMFLTYNYTHIHMFLQAVYTLLGGTKHITLTEFIAIMGVICMLFTQLPTFHSLW